MNTPNFEKPCRNYIEAWNTFRAVSDETKVIAHWLLSQKEWPKKPRFTIADFGCGDGLVAKEIMSRAAEKGNYIGSITLLDPNEDFLKTASQNVRDVVRKVYHPEDYNCTIDEFLGGIQRAPDEFFGKDVALFVHVVYLVHTAELTRLIGRMRPDVPLYIVLDHPDSVFSQLWLRTAKKYLDLVHQAHKVITTLPQPDYQVRRSKPGELISRFEKSALRHHLTGPPLVSMLCYDDKCDIHGDAELKQFFWGIVDKQPGAYVECRSVGYEIIRTR